MIYQDGIQGGTMLTRKINGVTLKIMTIDEYDALPWWRRKIQRVRVTGMLLRLAWSISPLCALMYVSYLLCGHPRSIGP
jgi:hypothetical protein